MCKLQKTCGFPKLQEAYFFVLVVVGLFVSLFSGGLRYWTSLASGLPDSWQPSSVDIELASYALMSHAKQQRLLEGASIMKWLSQQRNHLGGYASTQV